MSERSETEQEAMAATYAALVDHGYAGLTIQTIADEFPKSKSLLYYHYDDKDAILQEFLSYLVAQFRADFEIDDEDDPRETLEALLDGILPRDIDPERRAFRVALLELLARAPHDESYADSLTDLYAAIHGRIAAVITAGIESDAFYPVDAEDTATALVALASGGMLWGVTTDPAVAGRVRAVLDGYLDAELYR
ncbi:MAG: TetR family transcriptional regulator C-terminal domain-containing protein [Halobacteriales archaeon]|nr:TetR family transcriptional regulator C-terminal domain-containing protein [Halobacteriales archaeon]